MTSTPIYSMKNPSKARVLVILDIIVVIEVHLVVLGSLEPALLEMIELECCSS